MTAVEDSEVSAPPGSDEYAGTRKQLHLLVVDDDRELCERLQTGLRGCGYHVIVRHDGAAAIMVLEESGADLVLIDWELPGLHGSSLLQAVGWRWPSLPLVVITGHSKEERAIAAVDYAESYLRKPFSIEKLANTVDEVIAKRLRRANRRADQSDAIIVAGDIALHTLRCAVRVEGSQTTQLTSPEYAVLSYLLQHPDQVIGKKSLAQAIQPGRYTQIEAARICKNPVVSLRRKLEPNPRKPRYLRSHWGKGLQLTPNGS